MQALVVSTSDKLTSDGLKEFNATYPLLTKEKKKDFVQAEYRKIFEFGDRWEEVLNRLGIDKSQKANGSDKKLAGYITLMAVKARQSTAL